MKAGRRRTAVLRASLAALALGAVIAPANARTAPGADTVRPLLACVRANSDATYTAFFGYENDGASTLTIDLGTGNELSIDALDGYQPTAFVPGGREGFRNAAFSVTWDGSPLRWRLRGPGSSARSITATGESERCPPPTVIVEFIQDDGFAVTWKVRPEPAIDLSLRAVGLASCTPFGGANCGGLVQGGEGAFSRNSRDQYLLATQRYVANGQDCEVTNAVTWTDPAGQVGTATARYACSGASALGWPLLGAASAAAAAVAWWVRRRDTAWRRSS